MLKELKEVLNLVFTCFTDEEIECLVKDIVQEYAKDNITNLCFIDKLTNIEVKKYNKVKNRLLSNLNNNLFTVPLFKYPFFINDTEYRAVIVPFVVDDELLMPDIIIKKIIEEVDKFYIFSPENENILYNSMLSIFRNENEGPIGGILFINLTALSI